MPMPGGAKGRSKRIVSWRVGFQKRRPDMADATVSASIRHCSAPTDRIMAAIGFDAFWTPSGTPFTGGGATVFRYKGASSGITAWQFVSG